MRKEQSSLSLTSDYLYRAQLVLCTWILPLITLFTLAAVDAIAVQEEFERQRKATETRSISLSGPHDHLRDATIESEYQHLANEQLLLEVEKGLVQLRESFENAKGHHRTMNQGSRSASIRTQKDYRESLERIAKYARELRETLTPALPGIESNKKLQFQAALGDQARASFEEEMKFIAAKIDTAEAQIRRAPGVIRIVEGEENVLVCLYWVEAMANRVCEGG